MTNPLPKRKDRGQSIAVLLSLIVICILSWIYGIEIDYGVGALLITISILIHCPVFMGRNPPHPAVTVGFSVLQLILLVLSVIADFTDSTGFVGFVLFLAACHVFPAAIYIRHICAPKVSTSFIGMTWQETQELLPRKQTRLQTKMNLHSREKAYKQIAQYHSYLESGTMTQEEFEDIKAEILSSINK